MGVMCSLLGHDYGDADVKRERVEQGEEVVRTAKRVERCQNCGQERTVSENKEVTALEAAAGVVREPDGTVVAATDELNETVSEADGGEQAEGLRTSEDKRSESAGSERTDGPRVPLGERSESNGGEQVESLRTSADGSSAGSEPNEARRTSKDEHSESTGTIAIEKRDGTETPLDSPDSGESAPSNENEPGETGGIDEIDIDRIHDTGLETRDRPARAPGEWPAEPDDESTHALTPGANGFSSSGSLAAGESRVSWPGETDAAEAQPAQPSHRDAADGTESGSGRRTGRSGDSFTCTSCGFSAAVADSPLRAGDICPGCHRGYLAWETRKG
jgi:hypothetical protein